MRKFFFACMMLTAVPAFAVQPDEIMEDPALEARARALSGQLRCLVCQNQSIDDSDASLARDLRLLIREHLAKGEGDSEIIDFVVVRYGDFVLLKPRITPRTAILWAAPFTVLALAIVALWRRRGGAIAESEGPLSETEKSLLDKTLE